MFAIFAFFVVKHSSRSTLHPHTTPFTSNNANDTNKGLFFLHGSRFSPWRGGEPSPWTLPRTVSELQGTLPFCSRFSRISRLLSRLKYSGHFLLLRANSSISALGSHLGGEEKPLLGIFLEPLRSYRGHSLLCSRFSRVSRLKLL